MTKDVLVPFAQIITIVVIFLCVLGCICVFLLDFVVCDSASKKLLPHFILVVGNI